MSLNMYANVYHNVITSVNVFHNYYFNQDILD